MSALGKTPAKWMFKVDFKLLYFARNRVIHFEIVLLASDSSAACSPVFQNALDVFNLNCAIFYHVMAYLLGELINYWRLLLT